MKKLLPLALFPLLGLLCLALAWSWSRTELTLTLSGGNTEGVIRATVKARPAGPHDVLIDLDHTLVLSFADGARLHVATRNYRVESLRLSTAATPDQPLAADALSATPPLHPRLTPDLPAVIDELLRGDAARIQRVLERESAQPAALALLEIEKTEIARGWFNLAQIPKTFVVDAATDTLSPVSEIPLQPDATVFTTATFSRADLAAVKARKGDFRTHYERRVGDIVTEPARRDFILYDEPYATEFLPVYQYTVADRAYAHLAQIGRKGAPFSGFILQAPCRVAYDLAAPDDSILLPYLTAPKPGESKLNWFSNFCESLFSRWAYLATYLCFAVFFFITGGLLISLRLRPYVDPPAPPAA